MSNDDTTKESILVTGATGYVGGRLVSRLVEAGHAVRAAGRSLGKLESRPWSSHPRVELARMDVFDAEQVERALEGCQVAYYLIHSMSPGSDDFSEEDRRAATTFREAAARQGVERIIYLGGLGDSDESLSDHLSSRHEVGRVLGDGPVPTTVLRAGMIIGAGSASFEILRHLTEKLPIMITPSWVRTRTQAIGIKNVLDYLERCATSDEVLGRTFDIGGPDVVTYQDLMVLYAKEAGLMRRLMVPVPFLTPRLSSLWLHFVTPVTASLARPLIESLRNETVVDPEADLHKVFPDVELLTIQEAYRLALDSLQRHDVETWWSDAGLLPPSNAIYPGDPPWVGSAYFDRRQITVDASLEDVWEPIARIGGENGYYYGNTLWAVRGALDLLFGGPGLRRGRRVSTDLRPGDALDFWRVVRVEKPHNLKLLAEMRLPGRAHLDFSLEQSDGGTVLTQTASFEPRGLLGRCYWWSVWPLHQFVFDGMLRGIARACDCEVVAGPEPVRT